MRGKRILSVLIGLALTAGISCAPPLSRTAAALSVPTDNPITAKYGTTYDWTSEIKWSNVKNILDYGGDPTGAKDNITAFNAARDAASNEGGGVVYFPTGSYKFNSDLYLKNGVVIRGETPDTGKDNAKSDNFTLKTKFQFPKYQPTFSGSGTSNSTAFKKIYTTTPATDSNIGLLYVDINRAGIKLQSNANIDNNKNILVYGVRSNNVASADSAVPQSYQNAWQRWPNRFDANIAFQAYENILVANCRVNDAVTDNFEQMGYILMKNTDGSLVTLNDPGQAVFRYTDHYGIVVNNASNDWYATPATAPGLFRKGIAVRDNWIFKTMRNGIKASGDGVVVKGNSIYDQSDKVAWIYPTGYGKKPTGSVTYENRGIHMAGYNCLLEDNYAEVYTHVIGWTPKYRSNDGEGFLMDNTGSMVDGWTVRNNILKGSNVYIGVYRTKDFRNVTIKGNTIQRTSPGKTGIWLWADTTSANYSMSNIIVEDNTLNSGITCTAKNGIKSLIINNNTVTGNIAVTGDSSGVNNSGNKVTNNTFVAGGSVTTGSITLTPAGCATVSGNVGFSN